MSEAVIIDQIRGARLVASIGRVTRILPTYLEADGPSGRLGSLCTIESHSVDGFQDRASMLAEIVSIDEHSIRLAAFVQSASALPGAKVVAHAQADRVPVGDALLGRAVDGLARPLDGLGPIGAQTWAELNAAPATPLDRLSPREALETGVRAIDGLLTLDHGQRIGIFAAAGVGKTSLLTQMANQVQADRCVICLIGERGREVEALWSAGLKTETKLKSTLVAATSDQAAVMRVRAAAYAVALADQWRSEGLKVVLVIDSVTRLAMALREIGLAAGEPPTVRAYTPSVFSKIPQLVERCGALRNGGSITAIMTVLAETDDVDDPISEMMKSLLDGHIVLSRSLAEQGHFPAIDVPRSVSRLASQLMSAPHRDAAERVGAALSKYEEARTLIETGIYSAGSNPEIDRALELRPALMAFLKQSGDDHTPLDVSVRDLIQIAKRTDSRGQ